MFFLRGFLFAFFSNDRDHVDQNKEPIAFHLVSIPLLLVDGRSMISSIDSNDVHRLFFRLIPLFNRRGLIDGAVWVASMIRRKTDVVSLYVRCQANITGSLNGDPLPFVGSWGRYPHWSYSHIIALRTLRFHNMSGWGLSCGWSRRRCRTEVWMKLERSLNDAWCLNYCTW